MTKQKNIEIFIKEDIDGDFESLSDDLNKCLGLPELHDWEFGTGCSASDCFEMELAEQILKKLSKIKKIGKFSIEKVEHKMWNS